MTWHACRVASLHILRYARDMAKPTKKPAPPRAPRVRPVVAPLAPLPAVELAPVIVASDDRRSRGRSVSTLTAYVPPELARSLRIRAAEEGTTCSSIIGAALVAHLGTART